MNIFQAAAISVTCVLVALQFKYHKEEYSSFISIILCILILFIILETFKYSSNLMITSNEKFKNYFNYAYEDIFN